MEFNSAGRLARPGPIPRAISSTSDPFQMFKNSRSPNHVLGVEFFFGIGRKSGAFIAFHTLPVLVWAPLASKFRKKSSIFTLDCPVHAHILDITQRQSRIKTSVQTTAVLQQFNQKLMHLPHWDSPKLQSFQKTAMTFQQCLF